MHLCVSINNIEGVALLLAAGASPSSETDAGLMPLEYGSPETRFKRILPMVLRFGAPLPRFGHAIWMDPSMSYRRSPKMELFVAKIAAAGSWAAYEKAHTKSLVPVFEKIFPRPRLPHEIASHVVRFCFHTGHYS